jgi:hypothetical protein
MRFLCLAALLIAAVPASANTRPGMTGMGNMMGTHVIPVTVTGVNTEIGLVACNYGNIALKLHFPPAVLEKVKVGDTLQVMLAFSK